MISNAYNVNACSVSFLRILKETVSFHDWYLKDIYIANTGKIIHERSKRGYTTIQMEMCASNHDIGYLLIFTDVKVFNLCMERSQDVSVYSFTSFGKCDQYSIEQHLFTFEEGSSISITAGKAKCKKSSITPSCKWDESYCRYHDAAPS